MSPSSMSKPSGDAGSKPEEFAARVLGESIYDRVTSFLMAVVLGAMMIVGLMGVIYITNQAYASRVTAPLQIIEVSGGGGGSPEGTPGSTEKIDVPGADAGPLASNNEEEAGDFEEPAVQATPGAMIDAAAEAGASLAEVDLGPVMPSGGTVASGKRASKLGIGGPDLGFGPGDGGVASEQRWSIVYPPDQTPEEYARQLDALGVELAVVAGPDQLTYLSNLSSDEPTKRYGSGRSDGRLYFLWQGLGYGPDSQGGDPSRRGRASVLPQGRRGAARPARSALSRPPARRDPGHPVRGGTQGQRLRIPGHRPGDVAVIRDCGSSDSRTCPVVGGAVR